MKAKNILMTLLLVAGAIAAKASGYPAELALVSQPVMVYNHSSITVYYDVENIGDYTYRGDVYIFLEPDFGYYYAKEYVKVRPGRIKRIAVDIPAYSFDMHRTFTIMPYYEVGRDLYSFTTFEYFEPVSFYWHGPRTEPWVVIHVGPRPSYYHRPGSYRYYYDGYRPPMHAHGPGMPPPMDPMHHTYGYHYSIGGYPATHPEWSNNSEMPKPSNDAAPIATVRPKENAGSMSSGSNGNTSAGTNESMSSARPSANTGSAGTGSSSGSINRPSSSSSASGSVSRPSSNSSASRPNSSSNVSGSSTHPATNGSASRPNTSASSTSRPSGTSSSGVSRPSGSTSRPSGNSSSSVSGSNSRTSNSSSARTSSSSSSTRSSGASSARSSNASSSSRSGASTSPATGSGRR